MAIRRRRKKKRPAWRPPELSEAQIKEWVADWLADRGTYPKVLSGKIPGTAWGETWDRVDAALRCRGRGLTRKSSLADFTCRHFGRRHPTNPPPVSEAQLCGWVRTWQQRTGRYPQSFDGAIPSSGGETWFGINNALCRGRRGLPQYGSLANFLEKVFGRGHQRHLPTVTVAQLRRWALAHYAKHGKWPTMVSGKIEDELNWRNVDWSLRLGFRGLPGGSSLANFLAEQFGRVNPLRQPKFTIAKILAWADDFHKRHGRWPTSKSGEIPQSPGDTWEKIHYAFLQGHRGLQRGRSLAKLLVERRGMRSAAHAPALTVEQILQWADMHHERTGSWPLDNSGPISDAPGETWSGVDNALRGGCRGLPDGWSLSRLLKARRGVDRLTIRKPLAVNDILAWADRYFEKTGRWPTREDGPVPDVPTETWLGIDAALQLGSRSLLGGLTLFRLLRRERGAQRQRRRAAVRTAQTDRVLPVSL